VKSKWIVSKTLSELGFLGLENRL